MYRIVLNETSYYGAGCRSVIADEIRKRGFKKVLLVTDKDLIRFGVAAKIEEVLRGADIPYEIYSQIKANPTIRNVQQGVEAFKASGADCMVALGQSIALGTCAGFGTLFPAIFAGENLFAGKGLVLLLGVSITLAGIAVIGYAGSLRSQNMTDEEKRAAVKDFALTKGLAVALLAGVMSACFNLGLEAGRPLQVEGGSALFRTLPATLMVTLGGFVTNAAYCLWQNARNRTFGDYGKGTLYANNLLFCALAGALWYSQFFGFGIGQTFFEPGSVVAAFAWCILMALNVTFSNVWGIILREWRGASRKTVGVLVCGLAILIFSLVFPNLF